MPAILGIAVAGALGALARYSLDGRFGRGPGVFPWGTFVVNVSGSLLLGFTATVLSGRLTAEPWMRPSLTVGLLGAYTTFSTFSFESYRLLEDGAVGLALANAVGSLVAGLLAVYAGVALGRLV